MHYYLDALRKYGVFKGRSNRKEFWYFVLFNLLMGIAVAFIEGAAGWFPEDEESVLLGIYNLFVLIPYVAVSVRRMHDVNKNGWFILIPLYNLILLCRDSDQGPNQYGPDSKNEDQQNTTVMFCSRCGTPNTTTAKFCVKCGVALTN